MLWRVCIEILGVGSIREYLLWSAFIASIYQNASVIPILPVILSLAGARGLASHDLAASKRQQTPTISATASGIGVREKVRPPKSAKQ